LPSGKFRTLTDVEVARFKRMVKMDRPTVDKPISDRPIVKLSEGKARARKD
jgi:hypothetical protein